MPTAPDCIAPNFHGKRPTIRELASRQSLSMSRIGRWGRPQSWATVLVAIMAAIASFLLLEYA